MFSRARFSSAVTDIQSLLAAADPATADLDDATRAWLRHTRQAITAQQRTPGRDRTWDGVHRRARRSRRRVLVAAGALVVAVTVAGALVATPSAGRAPASSGHAKIELTAAQFLDRAAAVLLRQRPPAPPGPDQFVYTETETSDGQLSQTWLSADGKQAGLSGGSPVPTCAQLQKQQAPPPATPVGYCTAAMTAGYLPDLPARPGALRRYLTSIRVISPGPPPASSPNWAANDTGKAVDYLMATTYLLPAQQAALFQLLA